MTTDRYTYWKEQGGLSNAHRPHEVWWNNRERGIYLITIVTHGRKHVFGELNLDPHQPAVVLTKLGQYVEQAWADTVAIQTDSGRHIRSLGCQVMPDHFHGVLEVLEPMDSPLDTIIRDFKAVCTKQYRALYQPNLADTIDDGIEPLFDDNNDDTICYRQGQLENIIRYVADNPRRAVMRALYPDMFQRRQHLVIDGHDYAAYGNLFLLRRPWKEQVFCHRWQMINGQRNYDKRYETTDEFQMRRTAWVQAAKDGAVLVTPGISKGEQLLVKDCIEQALPLIQLQKEPIPNGWNPELNRQHLCEMGQLLILSPWNLSAMGDVERLDMFNGNDASTVVPAATDYSQFHNLNTLAARLCEHTIQMRIKI